MLRQPGGGETLQVALSARAKWIAASCVDEPRPAQPEEMLEDRGLMQVLTMDHHFEQAGFEVLLRQD